MILKDKIEEIRLKARENNVPILQDDSLKLIETILAIRKPETILEIGTAVGYSAICFSQYLLNKKSKILTIELNEEKANEAKENILNCGLEKQIEVINGDAYEYIKLLNEKFDVIFIDAAKGQYMKYLTEALRLVKSGSVIIADNVLFKGRVLGEYDEHKHRTAVKRLREYIDEITKNEKLSSNIFDIGDGVAVSVVK